MVTQLFDGFHLFVQVVSLNEVTQLKGRQKSLNVGLNAPHPAEAAPEILPVLSRERRRCRVAILKLQKIPDREKPLVLPQQCQNKTKARQTSLGTLAPALQSNVSSKSPSSSLQEATGKFLNIFRSPQCTALEFMTMRIYTCRMIQLPCFFLKKVPLTYAGHSQEYFDTCSSLPDTKKPQASLANNFHVKKPVFSDTVLKHQGF